MKYLKIIISAIISCSLVKCTSTGNIAHDYPEDITEQGKKEFAVKFKKGQVLYNINCAKCHNSTVNGKTVIPDFSLPQLMDYEIRIQYPEHSEDLKESNISPEELDLIVDFLRYKKRNPPAARK